MRKGDDREEEEGEEGEEEDAELLLRILTCTPCGDDVVKQNHQMRKEETAIIAKGVKRKRGQHECDVCGKMFLSPSKLAVHMRTHTNERPYECDVCEKRFTQYGHLQNHMRIHTNEKPYECDVCNIWSFERTHAYSTLALLYSPVCAHKPVCITYYRTNQTKNIFPVSPASLLFRARRDSSFSLFLHISSFFSV